MNRETVIGIKGEEEDEGEGRQRGKSPSQTMTQGERVDLDDESTGGGQQVASSTGGVGAPLRKKRSLEDKICRICGDKALAHNFDVITCESCKAFFRRNALKREELRECAFERSCPINMRTRRFCSACRLKKCFAIGMRADMILGKSRLLQHHVLTSRNGAGEKKRRVKNADKGSTKRPQPRSRPLPSCDSNVDSQPSSDDGSSSSSNCGLQHDRHYHHQQRSDCADDRVVGSTDQSDFPLHPMQQAPPPASHHRAPTTLTFCYTPRARCPGFEPVPVGKLPSDPHMYWRLTEDERALLSQITATYQNTILRLPQQGGASERSEHAVNSITLEDLLARCDVCANNVVKLMKGLADYRTLQVEDQLAALKACAMRTLILKGAACFVVERDAWIKAYGELPVSLFVRVTGHERLILRHASFCRSLKMLLKNDVTMYVLLQCVVLFNPRQPHIADRQLVNALRDKYLLLLKHYLQSQVSYEHAESYLNHLKDRLAELDVLAQEMTDMFKEWTALIQPLMIEVLSLA